MALPDRKGIDPAVSRRKPREKAARERALRIRHSFATVAEAFITDKLAQERSGKVAERDLRTVFVAAWGDTTRQRDHQARRAGDHQRARSAPHRRWPARCWS